jgi:hypothetical protein
MVNGRNKGADFERSTAKELFLELGISFKRDLEQTREAGHADLIPDDPAFPLSFRAEAVCARPDQRHRQVVAASHDRREQDGQAACPDLQIRPPAYPGCG